MREYGEVFMKRATDLARKAVVENLGGPFGSVIVRDHEIVGEGYNQVTSLNDPTAHAEIIAIRDACQTLNTFNLAGCTIYTSSEPCPMCLGAIQWARLDQVFYAAGRECASRAGFDDSVFYMEVYKERNMRKIRMEKVDYPEAELIFHLWELKPDKIYY
jgi:tRNA(Arg) A34 adenosine deaminase TadA